jgi:hypothetical protein
MRASLPEVERLGYGRWACSLANGEAHAMTVWIAEDEWLVMDAPLRELAAPAESWELLRRNSRLAGLSKFVLAADNQLARMRAEIPLGEEISVERRFRETCAGFQAALGSCNGLPIDPYPPSTQAQASPGDLAALCAEAGWASRQGSEVLRVDLSGQRAFLQATLETDATGSLRAYADLVPCDSWSAESRWALAALLLSASRVVRLARGFAEQSNRLLTAGFEVRFGDSLTAFELAHVLGALSAACALTSQEAQVLEGASVAKAYLDLRKDVS